MIVSATQYAGHDPQHAADRVRAEVRARLVQQPRAHERAVDQEARDHEEDRDADAEAREEGLRDRAVPVGPGGRQRVRRHDHHRRDRAQRVDQRKATRSDVHRTASERNSGLTRLRGAISGRCAARAAAGPRR